VSLVELHGYLRTVQSISPKVCQHPTVKEGNEGRTKVADRLKEFTWNFWHFWRKDMERRFLRPISFIRSLAHFFI